MDANTILDQLIKTGKELAGDGLDKLDTLAQERLNLPAAGPEREAALSNAGKGAAAATALLLLLGTKGGRALSSAALKVGSLAALGGLAYKAYRDWQADAQQADNGPAGIPVGELAGYDATARSAHLLRSMVAAASRDNQVTAAERQQILDRFNDAQIGRDAQVLFQEALAHPLTLDAIAEPVDSATFAAEVYLACAAMLSPDSAGDRDYLQRLAQRLELAPDLTTRLENGVWGQQA